MKGTKPYKQFVNRYAHLLSGLLRHCDDKRLRKVFQTMRAYGDHLQYSVFECQLTAMDLVVPGGTGGDYQPCRRPGAVRQSRSRGRARRPGDNGAWQTLYRSERAVHHRVTMATATDSSSREMLPDYLPARMVNEFAYCPRLFFYEWVEGLFRESADTVEGAIQHRRVDEKATALPDRPRPRRESIHSRSVTLSSERLRVIAKMDLVEAEGGVVTPVDYKHGRPREGRRRLELWPRTGRNWRSRGWCCARTGTGARKASSTTQDRAAGAGGVRRRAVAETER